MEEATWPEYIAALCRMLKDPKLPAHWSKNIFDHLHQLATMASHWDWHTCRQWSETVFTMIADGHLPDGWEDPYTIKDVQRDVCALGMRVDKGKNNGQNKRQEASVAEARTGNEYSRPDYNKNVDGKPCHPWNWDNECGFATSHGLQLDRKCHLCAWCINRYKANHHPEKICQNKKWHLNKINRYDDKRHYRHTT